MDKKKDKPEKSKLKVKIAAKGRQATNVLKKLGGFNVGMEK
jgi:hypothetical protein